MRDIKLEDTIYINFTTRAFATGVPTVLAGPPALSVLEENNATPITAGVSVEVDRASVVGLNQATIVATAANGYEAGKKYAVYISTGTVGGVSVVGEIVGEFTIQAAPVNWARVTAPSSIVDLSATDIQLCDTVTTLTNLPAITTDWLTATGIQASALDGKGDWNTTTPPTTAAIADAVWDETLAGHVTADTAGLLLNDWQDGGRLDLIVDAVKVKTDFLPSATAGAAGGVFIAGTNAATTVTTSFTTTFTGNLTGSVGSVAGNVDGNVSGTVDVGAIAGVAAAATNLEILFDGVEGFYSAYGGSYGPGIYVDAAAANTNTTNGVDGTLSNPVSTLTAARTLADSLGLKVYYIENNSTLTLAATHEDWMFVGLGSVADNVIDLGSQDVDRSEFMNITIQGTQGGTQRITAIDCALQDPGAGTTTLHIFAIRCGIVDDISLDTSNDNVFDQCFSLVAGTAAPIVRATGAAGTIAVRHYSGGIDLRDLSASHNVSIEGMGAITFDASCNVNATVAIRGLFTVTDNTGGMASLSEDARIDRPAINAEADTALTDYDPPTKAEMDTAHSTTDALITTVDTVVDAILVDTGTTLPATLATAAALTTAQNDLNTLTGTDGVTLATSQPNYAPATAANVNSELLDVLTVDTNAELGAVPAANAPISDKINWIYHVHRNKITSTSTATTVSNDAGTTIGTSTDSDAAGTFTRGEFS